MSRLDFRFTADTNMDLSIIIVNYNVKHFLEQCLNSVQAAIEGISAEIIVVDNNSTDNSLAYLKPNFPTVRFMPNTENLGFAKACNQGLNVSTGKYILFLNPDCIVPEDCFKACIRFLDEHERAGALGVRMLDGSGRFLKESKRSFPSPFTSLYKLIGLARLFPSSPVFAKYHLGHLAQDQDHEVDVLAGAFLMVKKEVLGNIGGFDETFFMYGEDIDLSYRIQKAGYQNYYFAGTSIIHFKGESTRKGSMNYVRMFYNAMSIFVRKHYGGGKAGLFNLLLHIAIWVRATLTAIGHFVRRLGLPLIDAGLILVSFWLVKSFWNEYVKTDIQYENELLWIAFPAYTVFYLVTAYYAGLYDKWYKWTELVKSSFIATIVLLAAYALLPEQYRFSRAILLFGVLLAFLLISCLRWLLLKTRVLTSDSEKAEHHNTIIVGSPAEYDKTLQLMNEAGLQERVIGRVAVETGDVSAIGNYMDLPSLSSTVPFREIIFCRGILSNKDVIGIIPSIPAGLRMKFHAIGSLSIVGSESKDSSGEAVSKENGFKINYPYNKRMKRLIDISFSIISIILFPVNLFLVKNPAKFLSNSIAVLFAQKTWIGYAKEEKNLPYLRKAIIPCNGIGFANKKDWPVESLQMMDYWYARDYEPIYDIKLLLQSYRFLGYQGN
jgi:GT2 family glycosyltransferase